MRNNILFLFLTIILIISPIWADSQSIPKYNRDDYGSAWSDDDKDGYNTREEVLIRDNKATKDGTVILNGKVNKGKWICPYTGTITTDPLKMDIDHVVPLSEAHISGAYQWTSAKKHQYYNYLKDSIELIAASGSANKSKGDKDPSQWMPSKNKCIYILNWVKIKKDWNLTMDPVESTYIAKFMKDSSKTIAKLKKKM